MIRTAPQQDGGTMRRWPPYAPADRTSEEHLAWLYWYGYIVLNERPLVFVRSALRDLRAFPDAARRKAGHELLRVQRGGLPLDWRPMSIVGRGVQEIRVHSEGEWRVIYIASLPAAVYVLHAFGKKSQRTNPLDIAVARARLRIARASAGP
jgi:phage-related protein